MLLKLGSPIVRLGAQAPELLGDPTAAGSAAVADGRAPLGPAPGRRPAAAAVAGDPAQAPVLAELARDLAGLVNAPAAPAGAQHPVLAELGLALAETASVLADVGSTWDQRRAGTPGAVSLLARPRTSTEAPVRPAPAGPPRTPAGPPRITAGPPPATAAPVTPAPPPAAPPEGPPVATGGSGPVTRTVRRMLSLTDLPHVIDHCFYRQPPGWRDLSDRFPVMPMTAVLQMMIDEARLLVPGREVVAVRDVRALRWVAIEPGVEVTIASTQLPDGAIRVSMDGFARVTVVFADSFPAAPAHTPSSADLGPGGRLPDEVPSPHQAAELYGGRWMFHGPGYQGITHVDGIAPLGVRGQLVVSDAPGALLDNIGQLYGYWATQSLDVDSLLLPQAVTEMRFFGPDPAPGDRMTCVARIRDVAAKTVTADLEVRAADGTVWCEVTGWTDRRFTANAWLWLLMRDPERNTVAEPRPDGWVVVPDYWRDIASRELVVRHFLDAARRGVLAGKNPRAAREWLLGRIAAADAVRRWLWAQGAGPVWGIEVVVDNDAAGRPVITSVPERAGIPADRLPGLSLAHKVDLAVALVDDEGDVGIDLEAVAVRAPGAYAAGLTPAEVGLLDALAGGAADPARGTSAVRAAQGAADQDGEDARSVQGAAVQNGRDSRSSGDAAELVRAAWFSRIWAAKEAVAKADGTGLQGRPRRYVVEVVVPAGAGASDSGADLAAQLGLAGEPAGNGQPAGPGPASEPAEPDHVLVDGIKARRELPAEPGQAEPPLLMRVAVLADPSRADDPARTGPRDRPARAPSSGFRAPEDTVSETPAPERPASADAVTPAVPAVIRRRWVALRTVDGMGRVRRDTGSVDPARLGDHIVAWTSPSVERAARARLPRALSHLVGADQPGEPDLSAE
jgi:phosphopantetheinyl transferase